jgi:hypothetical protein
VTAPLPGRSFTGFKALYEGFADDPLPSRSASGRFHDARTGRGTAYLAATATTAWLEVTHRWQAQAAAFRLATVRLRVGTLEDLTKRAARKRYGVDRAVLIGDEYQPCQRLAQRLRANGFEAAWTYSRAGQPEGRVLVVFLDRLNAPSRIERVELGPIPIDLAPGGATD